MSETSCWPWRWRPAGKIELEQHDMHLPGSDPGRANQFVVVHRARSERAYDLLAFALADFRQRLRCPVLVGRGKLDRRGRGTFKDRRQGFEDVARGCGETGALLEEIVGAGRARIERVRPCSPASLAVMSDPER